MQGDARCTARDTLYIPDGLGTRGDPLPPPSPPPVSSDAFAPESCLRPPPPRLALPVAAISACTSASTRAGSLIACNARRRVTRKLAKFGVFSRPRVQKKKTGRKKKCTPPSRPSHARRHRRFAVCCTVSRITRYQIEKALWFIKVLTVLFKYSLSSVTTNRLSRRTARWGRVPKRMSPISWGLSFSKVLNLIVAARAMDATRNASSPFTWTSSR